MRSLRIGLTLALALLIAVPVLAQQKRERGKRPEGATRGFGMFGGVAGVERILGRLTLSDDEKAATKAILDEYRPKVEKLQKAAALTEEQRKQLQDAMAKVKESGKTGAELRQAMQEAMQSVKRTDDQVKAQKELGALMKELQSKILEKLSEDNKAAFKKAIERPFGFGAPGARGTRRGGAKKQ
ncbi:MAG: hypothetical protein ACUVUC_04620 [Thermoguttaceae bacterium]